MRKSAVWQKDGGVKRWVEEMPPALLASQFPRTPPIFVNERLVDKFFKQQGRREIEIQEFAERTHPKDENFEDILDVVFPQHWESCNMYNRPCPYKRLCFGAEVDPLSIGYTPRYSHHPLEQQQLDENEI